MHGSAGSTRSATVLGQAVKSPVRTLGAVGAPFSPTGVLDRPRAVADPVPPAAAQPGPARAAAPVIRLMVVDESAVIRDGLCALLSSVHDIEVVAVSDSGAGAVQLARTHAVQVVLTGLSLHGMSCFDLLRRLEAERLPVQPRLVVFAQHDNEDVVRDVLRAPTHGLLVKDTSPAELAAAVRAAAQGEAVFSPSVSSRLVKWFRSSGGQRAGSVPQSALDSLTTREHEVLRLIAEGMSPVEMAAELCIGEATVRTHVYRLRTKLELRDRAQLVAFAHRAGLANLALGEGPAA